MTPLTHAIGKTGVQHALGAQEIEQLVLERLAKCIFRQRRQHPERAGGQEYAIGDQRMDVRVKGDEVTEGLHILLVYGLAEYAADSLFDRMALPL